MADRSHSSERPRSFIATGVILLLALVACQPSSENGGAATRTTDPDPLALAPSGQPYSEDRTPCADRAPERQALWGELHVHSSLSMDAWLWDVRNGPDATYRFAKGEKALLPPLDEAGVPTRAAQLERPIDFAALTDHASFQGEVALCSRPGSSRYTSQACRLFRGETEIPASPLGDFGVRMSALSDALDAAATSIRRNAALCGDPSDETCRSSMKTVWEEQQAAAERHYDRSEGCRFTTLHAYEYTATPGLAKVHHNVIFRNANVPASPIAWIDEPDVYGLWDELRKQCLEAGIGCDVITLPHNSNLSNGNMFAITGTDLPLEQQRARAVLRGDIERLVEITQIKGDSECRNGFAGVIGATDEFCGYEEWRGPEVEDCGADGKGYGALMDKGCVSRKDYVRYALLEGFREQRRIGVNPFKLGIIAATDTHNANPGDVEEYSYQGWQGSPDATPQQRLDPGNSPINAKNSLASNPGGIAGVWAEENSRDAIFDAMKRKETFGTSGPRITARFFAGWDYPEALCGDPELVAKGYSGGVPMGGDLPPRPDGARAPTFVLSAMRDLGTPDHPGGLLQRAQIVKGWVDAEGDFHQEIIDVAGGANEASVDGETCQPRGVGHNSLCRVWTDPDFDAARNAVYYARVLENPSCRWSAIQCLEEGETERNASCADPSVPKTIQERLWTSPIWYEPGPSERAPSGAGRGL
ncbi:MAG: DUF3604 domain-containing protein [bacterium]|nr:hypothetical protein [Deltaproteobacteria bacterium]MCP4904241.1 DUF3604 domain-containing protein [bacterium]